MKGPGISRKWPGNMAISEGKGWSLLPDLTKQFGTNSDSQRRVISTSQAFEEVRSILGHELDGGWRKGGLAQEIPSGSFWQFNIAMENQWTSQCLRGRWSANRPFSAVWNYWRGKFPSIHPSVWSLKIRTFWALAGPDSTLGFSETCNSLCGRLACVRSAKGGSINGVIHLNGIFPNKNHPAIGLAPWLWKLPNLWDSFVRSEERTLGMEVPQLPLHECQEWNCWRTPIISNGIATMCQWVLKLIQTKPWVWPFTCFAFPKLRVRILLPQQECSKWAFSTGNVGIQTLNGAEARTKKHFFQVVSCRIKRINSVARRGAWKVSTIRYLSFKHLKEKKRTNTKEHSRKDCS